MTKQILIRWARKKEGKSLLGLIDALADFEKLKKPNKTARARLIRDAFGKRKRFDVLLAFINKETVGYAIIFETYSSFRALPTLYLEDIFVLPEFRKQGIGLKLFKRCVSEARKRGCGRMDWMVLDWNKNAIRFYRKQRATLMKAWLLYRLEF
jgi:GNAT superfamily N-acetyltransferase